MNPLTPHSRKIHSLPGSPGPGRTSITIRVEPNPIVATRVSGNTYDFPFDIVIRATGPEAVKIAREVLTEAGLDPNLVQLAPEEPEAAPTSPAPWRPSARSRAASSSSS